MENPAFSGGTDTETVPQTVPGDRTRPAVPLAERFWPKVRRGDGCWEWTACKTMHGYGRISVFRRGPQKAHRVAWELTHGPIPAGKHVLHSCDNPACVRPDHLRLGTHLDNMRDMFARGRRVARADKNNAWKLTADDVREIRRLYAGGGITQRELGRRYGVSGAYIGDVVAGKAWAYVA